MIFRAILYLVFSAALISITHSVAEDKTISESIGFYTAGCIKNSQMLKDTGEGYQVIRLSRQRYYGHSRLVEFIEYLGKHTRAKLSSTLLIGDMSQKTGGPLPSDHASHQTGLDADIMYLNQPYADLMLSVSEREEINPISVLTAHKTSIKKGMWNNKYTGLLVLASAHPDVDRIFINPVIKNELCKRHRKQPWLRKIRPWYGHDGHFHVRLSCPEGNLSCENQKPLLPGDGCGEDLKKWFIPPPKKSEEDKTITKPRKIRQMPEQCLEIFSN